MYHSSTSVDTGPRLAYPRSDMLALLPTIDPFMTSVMPTPDHLYPLREIEGADEIHRSDRIVSEPLWFGRLVARVKENFRRSH